jgi:hypothetical protein
VLEPGILFSNKNGAISEFAVQIKDTSKIVQISKKQANYR